MSTPRWRIYQKPPSLGDPSRLLGMRMADTKDEALASARETWPDRHLEVISEIAWAAMTPRERAIADGTYAYPQKTSTSLDQYTRTTTCDTCHGVIRYHRDDSGKWRRPPKYHQTAACMPSNTWHSHQHRIRQKALDTVPSTP